MPEKKFVSMEEACALLQCSRWTVYRRVRDGLLTKYKTHFGVRFLREQVEALAAEELVIEEE